ncbi:hypothetical protein FHX37_3570 [Haloactinospora alba]|uniref:Uncharacterized protein n=1 Tax=Haloactinospora alba TaxID=405555 RepID=A0A543NNZ7_9ACTN|nr:hypothetical protein [Haloactinospora alba]TQN33545.1 hypothetical protein FHX37_3570 [Haloactinospora alba]
MRWAQQPHYPIGDLISDKWILSIDDDQQYVAFRPLGWTGPDPHERMTAETCDALLAKLRYRARHEDTRHEPIRTPLR